MILCLFYIVFEHIQMMLFLGFGFLMTFLRRFGYSALVQTMVLVAVSVEWATIMQGATRIDDDGFVDVSLMHLADASVASAPVLISFGAIIGKVNLLQVNAIPIQIDEELPN